MHFKGAFLCFGSQQASEIRFFRKAAFGFSLALLSTSGLFSIGRLLNLDVASFITISRIQIKAVLNPVSFFTDYANFEELNFCCRKSF